MSRWLWLVKWVLLIPHYIVLWFLFIAMFVLTVIAFFAILFTGRYPRAIFDFNVGVLRWAWRVGFYGYSALGTDRYPPFSFAADANYPATLDVPYPEHLSRGWCSSSGGCSRFRSTSSSRCWPAAIGVAVHFWGLIAILTLFAALALLFTSRYPRGIFDFVMGLNRWVFRVLVYVLLMRDEYPPFRFDPGGSETPPMPSRRPLRRRCQPIDRPLTACPCRRGLANRHPPAIGVLSPRPRSRWTRLIAAWRLNSSPTNCAVDTAPLATPARSVRTAPAALTSVWTSVVAEEGTGCRAAALLKVCSAFA